MKKICSLLVVAMLLTVSCKKDHAVKTKVPLLSRAYNNGATVYQFYYTPQNLLSKIELYDEGPGNALMYHFDITYNGSQVSQIVYKSMPGEVPVFRLVYSYDQSGRVLTSEYYDLAGPTPNVPTSTDTYTYNTDGILSSVTSKDKTNVFLRKTNFLHYPDGKLKESQQFLEQSNQLYMVAKSTYSIPAVGDRPGGLEEIEKILGPEFPASFFYESYNSLRYTQAGVITTNYNYLLSGREYNSDGTIQKQVMTIKNIKPVNPDVVIYKDYEYILQ
ncbi:MAG: hypothetical protein ABI480_16585 [Chitinophagaceae bacterium]